MQTCFVVRTDGKNTDAKHFLAVFFAIVDILSCISLLRPDFVRTLLSRCSVQGMLLAPGELLKHQEWHLDFKASAMKELVFVNGDDRQSD